MSARTVASSLIRRDRVGDVAVLRLSDPERSNALTPTMTAELRAAVAAVDARALLICAEGRNFCSGGDHDAFMALSPDDRRAYFRDVTALFTDVRDCAAPTVACVQGAVIGGGVDLALHCDLLVAAADARFQLPYVAARIRLGETSHAALSMRTGVGFARRLLLLGENVDAQTALAAGLVDVVTGRADLYATGLSLATTLAAQPEDSLDHARRRLATPQ